MPRQPLKKLTDKARAFALEYIVDFNGTQAAIRAGYSPKTAHVQANHLLKDPLVQAEIKKNLDEQRRRTKVTADDVIKEMASVAMLDLSKAFDQDGELLSVNKMPADIQKALASVRVREHHQAGEYTGKTTTIRVLDKLKALEMLGRHFKLFTEVVEVKDLSGLIARARKRARMDRPRPVKRNPIKRKTPRQPQGKSRKKAS